MAGCDDLRSVVIIPTKQHNAPIAEAPADMTLSLVEKLTVITPDTTLW